MKTNKTNLATATSSLPTRQSMRNRRGDVVLPLHAKTWTSECIQRLSLVGRGVLVEILMQFALGYRTINVRMISAICSVEYVQMRDLLVELVEERLILVVGDEITVLPEVVRPLMLGAESTQ